MNQTPPILTPTAASAAAKPPGVVAIVDDDPQIAGALGMWLELQGLGATCHLSAESLLDLLRLQDGQLTIQFGGAHPEVVLGAVLDLNLPGKSGVELARMLRALTPDLPITLITALGVEQRGGYGKLPSGVQCLKKPFDLDALELALFPLAAPYSVLP